jgi:DNA-binding NtrC family response regulator
MRKLLIVDDDAGLAKAYARIGAEAGFEVSVVNDPLKATEVFLELKPDVVVIDMIMPEKDGIDVLNEVLLTGVPVRIIVTSGYGDAMLRLAKSVANFHASDQISVLKKPVRRAEFKKLLTETSPD